MNGWPARSLAGRLGIAHPILLAPMAGAGGVRLAIAVAQGGGLGALPCGMATPEQIAVEVAAFRAAIDAPINLNFFCHTLPPPPDDTGWLALLAPYYAALGAEPGPPPPLRQPFSAEWAALVTALRPEVVSFHFGLPEPALLNQVRAAGAFILASATSAEEGQWLAANDVDAVIAQGWEAGGHCGHFLTERPGKTGLLALVRQLADSVGVPVIAAGGIMDGAGIRAVFDLGAAAVQLGTAFLACPESLIAPPYRTALASSRAGDTLMTNLFSGRLARGIRNRLIDDLGPVRVEAPPYPYASSALAPLRRAAEAQGSDAFTPLWAGQAAALARPMPASDLMRRLVAEAGA